MQFEALSFHQQILVRAASIIWSFFVCTCGFNSIVSAQSMMVATLRPEKIASGFQQPEGPLWIDSLGLIVSDIKASTIYRWSPADSAVRIFLHPSDSSNGLTLDRQGRLVLTQMGLRRIARRETNGAIIPLASAYQGKRFNSPNDIVVKSDGSIFFTDPDFNIPAGQQAQLSFRGIFCLSPSGVLRMLDSTLDKPNGICFSPDEKKLFVNDSHKCQIYVWTVVGDTAIIGKSLFYTLPASGYAGGMKMDSAGILYCTGPGGVWMVSSSGTLLGMIDMTETPSNCAWGDADRNTLYVTAGASLYRIKMSVTGIGDGIVSAIPIQCELYSVECNLNVERCLFCTCERNESIGHTKTQ